MFRFFRPYIHIFEKAAAHRQKCRYITNKKHRNDTSKNGHTQKSGTDIWSIQRYFKKNIYIYIYICTLPTDINGYRRMHFGYNRIQTDTFGYKRIHSGYIPDTFQIHGYMSDTFRIHSGTFPGYIQIQTDTNGCMYIYIYTCAHVALGGLPPRMFCSVPTPNKTVLMDNHPK